MSVGWASGKIFHRPALYDQCKFDLGKCYGKGNASKNGFFKIIFSIVFQKNYDFMYALCLPSTCNEEEIEYGIQSSINVSSLKNLLSMQLKKGNCRTKESKKLKSEDWLAM